MYVKPNNEVCSCKHCCSGKAIRVICSKGICVACNIQHSMCMCHTAICCLSGSTVFFPIMPLTAWFLKKKKKVTEYKMCVLIFPTTFVWNISYSEKNSVRNYQKHMRAVRKVSSHFEYLQNRSSVLDVTWQPVRGDLTVHLWTVTLPRG